jgi:hypothetical protein
MCDSTYHFAQQNIISELASVSSTNSDFPRVEAANAPKLPPERRNRMPCYNIAGFPVCYDAAYTTLQKHSEKYVCDEVPDAVPFSVSPDEIAALRPTTPLLTDDLREYMLMGKAFYEYLISRGGMMLHASAVVLDGEAYLFSAPSGTGKSTHTSLWLRRFPQSYILNDDKPALFLREGRVFAAGTPFSGKYDCSVNEAVPLRAIAFLARSDVNRIEPIPDKRALYELLNQTSRPADVELFGQLLRNVAAVIENTPIYKLYCNMDVQAAEVAYAAMRKGEKS